MNYSDLVKAQVARHGIKAILFASERNEILTESIFETPELQYMPTVTKETLERLLKKRYEASQTFVQQLLSSSRKKAKRAP